MNSSLRLHWIVGSRNIPASAINRIVSSERSLPCSMLSAPAMAAIRAVLSPPWMVTGTPCRCASSIPAINSSGGIRLPRNLMSWTPFAMLSATISRIPSTPLPVRTSQSVSPSVESGGPPATIRGPTKTPASNASFQATSMKSRSPVIRSVVKPAFSASIALRPARIMARNSGSSSSMPFGSGSRSPRWEWLFHRPGRT